MTLAPARPTGPLPPVAPGRPRVTTTTVHRGSVGEAGSMYTRLLATDPDGPNAGALLLTWELRLGVARPGGPAFPVRRSDDGGRTWREVARVVDPLGRGNRYQPVLYELPGDLAHLRAGDLLLAGNAIPADGSTTTLVLHSSRDGGATWRFEAVVDEGGPATYDPSRASTTTSVWEPDLLLLDGVLHVLYADEREKARGMLQTISRRRTEDLRTWTPRETVVGVPNRWTRPGMFVATGPLPDGTYRAVVEVVGPHEVPIHLRTSVDGVDWGDPADLGPQLVAVDGVSLSGTPNLAWCPDGRGGATLVATARHSWADGREANHALVSDDGGATWRSMELPVAAVRRVHGDSSGYSQSVRWNAAGELVQATTVRNAVGSHDVVVAVVEGDWRALVAPDPGAGTMRPGAGALEG
ncbi:sialidase family protein [Cellulomonas endophytica]|uniref:sialidase family protein n=1 Tax=Cellulomonas endophytica TaxID=2494735 RepID=UPI00101291FF|nr:sialidase family protein [Cellulomonas endophytica]